MDAEKKASTVVAEARAARSDRLKAAKAEAGAAVDDLRAARESEHALTTSSDSDAKEAQAIAATADGEIAAMKALFEANKGAVQCGNQPVRQAGLEVLFTILAASTQRESAWRPRTRRLRLTCPNV